jgi:TPR repeat protein
MAQKLREGLMASKIFISYRRDDSAGTAGRLHDRLAEKFGHSNLFIDVDNMPAGTDFVEYLGKQVAICDIFLCAIGPHWLDNKDDEGRRRLDQPDDFVRVEIAEALKRKIPVIPVLIDGARVPKARELPDDLAPLTRRQAVELRNSQFGRDADALTQQIRAILREKHPEPSHLVVASILGGVALLVVGSVGLYRAGIVSVPWIHSGTNTPITKELPNREVVSDSDGRKSKPQASSAPSTDVTEALHSASPSSAAQTRIAEAPRADPVTDCDWLAAFPTDAQRPKIVPGAWMEQIDVSRALPACNEAVNKFPDVARFSYELGRVLIAAKDYPASHVQLERAASLGSTSALAGIGYLFAAGLGVPQDYAEAKRWYDKAVVAGNATAMTNIGVLYHDGHGVTQDYAEARRWYERAAAAGDPAALSNIGNQYRDGKGVQQDYVEARHWYEKAAMANIPAAMNSIGTLYRDGKGVPQDYQEAKRWYEKAAAAGNSQAMTSIGLLYNNGQGVTQDYAEAKRWYEKAASAGFVAAMIRLGDLYRDGLGVTKSVADARSWYQKAAAGGSPDAQNRLAALPSD